MTHFNPDLRVTHFRWRADDGTDETDATWLELEDIAHTLAFADLDTNIRLRYVIQEANTDEVDPPTYQLQRNIDGGGFGDVDGSTSTGIRASGSTKLTDDEITTDQIGGTGTFADGRVDDVDGATTTTITQAQTEHTEVEFCFQARSADLSGGEAITFQLTSAGGSNIDANDVTPTLNIGAAPGAESLIVKKRPMRTHLTR